LAKTCPDLTRENSFSSLIPVEKFGDGSPSIRTSVLYANYSCISCGHSPYVRTKEGSFRQRAVRTDNEGRQPRESQRLCRPSGLSGYQANPYPTTNAISHRGNNGNTNEADDARILR
jgi:hypothetical protein